MTTIKKLRMAGFKSFAKPTDMIYPEGFSVVIGPNGSGKSNVMDSLCFVLGKSSAKEMRAEKSSNLIYNGGKNGKPSKEAEVSIWFDNSKNHFKSVQEPEVKISRIVRHTGQSIYKINDKTQTRQDIIDLLNSSQIDPDGYNIILQGDIIRFMEMRPLERRKIIEEAAGISVYEERKEKALSELDGVERRVSDAEIVMKERNANLRELKKERDQAVNYKKVQDKIKSDKATYFTLQINQKKEQQSNMEASMEKQKAEILEITNKISQIKEEIELKKQNIQTINDEIEVKGEKEQVAIHKEIEELREDLIKRSMRLETCKSELIKIKQRNQQLQKDTEELEKKSKELKSEISSLDSKKSELNKKHSILKLKIDQLTNVNSSANINHLTSLQRQVSELSEEKSNLLREHDKLGFQLNEIEDKLSKVAGSKSPELRKDFTILSKKLASLLEQDANFALKLSSLREDSTSRHEELAKLRTREIIFKEKSLSSVPVQSILQAGIKGVHDTISELGEIDKKHSLALQTAAGNKLHAIVVRDDTVAETCINHLKKTKSGTAIFLPLNKIKPNSISSELLSLEKQQGVVGFAINLIRFDPEFKNAFSHVLGSTLVVNDIPTARKIGIGKIRMVTLEGDLVDSSGAMVGGYKRLTSSFKEKDMSSSIEKLESELSSIDSDVMELQNKRNSNEAQIHELRQKKANLEADIIRAEKTLSIFDPSKLKQEKSELTEKMSGISNEVKTMEDALNKTMGELEELSKLTTNEDTRIKQLRELESQRQEFSSQISGIDGTIKSIQMQLSMMETERIKIVNILKTNQKSSEEFEDESEELTSSLQIKKKHLDEKDKQEKEFYTQFKNLFNQRNKITDLIKQEEIVTAKYEEKIKFVETRLNTLSIERARIIGEMEGLQEEMTPFKEQPIRHGVSIPELKVEIQNAERTLNGLGNVNMRALEVYETLEKEFDELTRKIEVLKVEKQDILDMMTEIEGKKDELFMKTFNAISKNFERIFSFISTKGAFAHLEIQKGDDVLEPGVDIKVRIKGNRFLDIRGLSGGEKTLTALAFIFSIQEYSPSPFYLFDEVDAALDKANSEKLSKLIAQYAKTAQYIVISHNDAIVTEADQIYGISMQDEVSKVVSLKI